MAILASFLPLCPTEMGRKLAKRTRDEVPVILDLAEEIEKFLTNGDFDRADPSLEPSLQHARQHAHRLKAFLSDIDFLVETEHGGNS